MPDSIFSPYIFSLSCVSRLSLLTMLFFIGCAPKVTLSPGAAQGLPNSIAVLPASYTSGLAREKIDLIRSQVISELESRSFVVLSERSVHDICGDATCLKRDQLFSRYQTGALVELNVESISRNNFLAGFVNYIRGTLIVRDQHNVELAKIEHTAQERGGLLFNSGQILQGLSSQIENGSEQSFPNLSSKFTKALVSKLPAPLQTQSISTDAELMLTRVEVKPRSPQIFELCGVGTPKQLGSVVIAKQRSSLRELSPGRYCGVFRLENSQAATNLSVELRSPYGAVARAKASAVVVEPCQIMGPLMVTERMSVRQIDFKCDSPNASFLIYRAASEHGPFLKIAETKQPHWEDYAQSSSAKMAYYAVVARSRDGISTLPTLGTVP